MARLLDKSDFGTYAIANAVIGLMAIFTEFGFGAALIQKDEVDKHDLSFTLYASLTVACIAFFSLYFAAPYLSKFYEGGFSSLVIQGIAILFILKSMTVVSKSLLIRELDFKALFVIQNVSYFIGNICIGICLAYHGYGVWSLVGAILGTNLAMVLLFYFYKPHSLVPAFSSSSSKAIFKYGKNLTFLRFFHQFSINADKFIIGKTIGLDTLGIYERVQRLVFLPKLYLGNSVDSVLFSFLSRIKHEKAKASFVFFRILSLSLIPLGLIFVNILFYSEELIHIFLGSNWESAIPIFQMLSILILIDIISKFSNTLVRSTNYLQESTRVKIIFSACIIFGVYIGSRYGIYGVVFGYVLASLLHNVMMAALSLKILEEGWMRYFEAFRPSLTLILLIVIKNGLITVFLEGISGFVLSVLLDCILLFSLAYRYPNIIGIENINFIKNVVQNTNLSNNIKLKRYLPSFIFENKT